MTGARVAAARALVALERGRTTLAAEVERERTDAMAVRDRALFLEIALGTVRWRNELDACLGAQSRRPIADLSPEVRSVLRTGAYQLLHLDRVPVHAAVSEAVEVVRALGQARASGFVNAVLRKIAGPNARRSLPPRPGNEADHEAAVSYLSVTLSHPDWLVRRWLERVGLEATERWCLFNNAAPTLTVRPLGFSAQTEEWLRAEAPEARPARFASQAFELAPGVLGRLPEDLRSSLAVQDEGSQLVAELAGVRPGDRVLDLCASPGGKTLVMQLAAGPEGQVIACDFRRPRVQLLRAQLRRAGAPAPVLALDAREPLPFRDAFDRVLIDAPCSGLGTLRRDPDLKWTRAEADLKPLAAAELVMLSRAAEAVRPGGVLIYATCSSEPEENQDVVAAFLSSTTGFRRVPLTFARAPELIAADGCLETRPYRDNLDAYFAAHLQRT
jgi:16S rRNA (cytosine967-C5)-methyltransferase